VVVNARGATQLHAVLAKLADGPVRRWGPWIVFAVALAAAGVVLSVPEWFSVDDAVRAARYEYYAGIRWVRDDWDRVVYLERGVFIRDGGRPYVDVPSEYPQLATYLFGLPWTLASTPGQYLAIFTGLMAAALGGLAFVVAGLCRRLGVSPARCLLLLLPASLYFTLNRFDVVPALVCTGALWCLLRGNSGWAFALLAVAVLTKAYPVLYLPLFAAVVHRTGGWPAVIKGGAAFAAVIIGCSVQLAMWSGIPAVFAPYAYQLGRPDNTESLYHLLRSVVPAIETRGGQLLLVGLQLLPAFAVLLVRPASPRQIVRWMAAITLAFVLFARFQSPQWLLWIAPLALVGAVRTLDLALVIAIDLLSYLYFPVIYDLLGEKSGWIAGVILLISILRIVQLTILVWPAERNRSTALQPSEAL
jgi:hypothetical protein